jgi:hypothetical protein
MPHESTDAVVCQSSEGTNLFIRSSVDFITTQRELFLVLASVLLFLTSLGRCWASYNPGASDPGASESWHLALNLYRSGEFANPFATLDTGPSAHLSPVFPAFLAVLMRVFGGKTAEASALAAAAVLSFQVALYPTLSKIFGMGEINGIVAALALIFAGPRLNWAWDAHYVAILLAAVSCCYRRYLDESELTRRKLAWLLGASWGFLIFTSPAVAPIYATWIALEAWHRKGAFWARSLAPLVLLPILIVLPWAVRNYLVFHRFPIIRDNFGLELSVSNNDCAGPTMSGNFRSGCFATNHPNGSVNEARRVLELGEVRYNELKLREALSWIRVHPGRFAKLSIERFVAFWMPVNSFSILEENRGRWLEFGTTYLMTILSGIGLVALYRRDVKSALVLASCLAAFPPVYYVVQSSIRYRYPIMWVTFLLGAIPITMCAQRLLQSMMKSHER